MAIALAEADKYEILDKIGELNRLVDNSWYLCLELTPYP